MTRGLVPTWSSKLSIVTRHGAPGCTCAITAPPERASIGFGTGLVDVVPPWQPTAKPNAKTRKQHTGGGSYQAGGSRATGVPSAAMRVALIACLLACGKGETTPKKHDDAGLKDAAVVEVGPFALGMPDLEAYKWRARGGHPAFRTARESEATGDWPTVITTCK